MPVEKYAALTDPGIRSFLMEGDALYPPGAVALSLEEQRSHYNRYAAHFSRTRDPGLAVEDVRISGVSCRRYVPPHARGATLLYLHGGGFILGGLDSHDSIVADLAAQAGVAAVAVQYRLAPEHPFPAAFDDCWAVFVALLDEGIDVVLAGDSAGGNLAAAVALKARDLGIPGLSGQVLIYPGLGGDMNTGTYVSQAHAPGLSTEDVAYYHRIYGGAQSKYAWPLLETDYAGLARAFIVVAGIDPLHDDGIAYAERLTRAGVAAELRDEHLLVHAYLRARGMSQPAAESFNAIVAAIQRFAA
jgi:acetyl esterase